MAQSSIYISTLLGPLDPNWVSLDENTKVKGKVGRLRRAALVASLSNIRVSFLPLDLFFSIRYTPLFDLI